MARITVARGPFRWAMRRIGIVGIAMPWRTVYLLPEYKGHQGLIAHELVHIEQIERDGPIRFSIQYLWWLVTRGYWNVPYEIEAYARAPLD